MKKVRAWVSIGTGDALGMEPGRIEGGCVRVLPFRRGAFRLFAAATAKPPRFRREFLVDAVHSGVMFVR